jgi:ferredoxin
LHPQELAQRLHGSVRMANRITEECINCGACEPECPNQAITQGEDFFAIDAAKCDECKAKEEPSCKSVCPTECIVQA